MGRAFNTTVAALTFIGGCNLIGLGSGKLKYTNVNNLRWEQTDTTCISPEIGPLGFYACLDSFTEDDKRGPMGNRIAPHSDLIYTPNTQLGSDATAFIVSKLVGRGMECPDDPDTETFYPHANPAAPDATLDTSGAVELDICFDFEHATSRGNTFKIPLMLKPEYEVPQQELNYPKKTLECTAKVIRYAGLANAIVIAEAQDVGIAVPANAQLPIDISVRHSTPNPCDMGALEGAH